MQCGRCGTGLEADESRQDDGRERRKNGYISAVHPPAGRAPWATLRHLEVLRAPKQHEQVLITWF